MTVAERYFQEICNRCENHAKDCACEDLQTCPAYKLYCLAREKKKVIIKHEEWQIPPTPRPEMI